MFRYTKRTLALEIVVILAALALLMPFWILVTTALKPGEEVLTSAAIAPPRAPTLENFKTLLSPSSSASGQILKGLLSSLIITAGSIAGLVALGSMTSYVLIRSTSRWSRRAFYLFLVAIVLPTQLGVLPLYVGAQHLGLVGSRFGMILIYWGVLLPLAVFLYAGFFRELPRDYEESAMLDGASPFQVFTRVVFPLMGPATGTVAILTGLIVWNDFFTPLIFLNGSDAQTLPVVMYNFVGSLVSQWNLIFAVVLISMVPILAFYVFAQKRFIQGFSGGIKS
ncbi:carbohydrate ABC transporter permease [Phycicoccus sp. Soil803]|uniref:carbohydrate ABC transporter permease n=1 Tax=Phycicoccus sp. Soil803 TaxID=1736415 RepID=UPI00070F3FDB|nr:carbohydrate ABC transporter permease [Phycicoccus sp. Soil803]KRF25982.1 ABC transporter permease [Phycicoccus sp. Soil803]